MKNLTYSLLLFFLTFLSCEEEEISCFDCSGKTNFFGSMDVFEVPSPIYSKIDAEQDDWYSFWFGITHPQTVVGTLHGLKKSITYYRDTLFHISEIHIPIDRPDFAIEVGGMSFSSTFYSMFDNQGIERIIEIGEDEDFFYFNHYEPCVSGVLIGCDQDWVLKFRSKQSKNNLQGEADLYQYDTRQTGSWAWEKDSDDQFIFSTTSTPALGFDSEQIIKIRPNGSGSITVIDECFAHHLELPNCTGKSERIWSWNARGIGIFQWEAADESTNW